MNRLSSSLTTVAVLALGLSLAGCSAPGDAMSAGAASATPSHPAMMSESAAPIASSEATMDAMAHSRHGIFAGSGDKTLAGEVTIEGTTIEITGFHSDEAPDLHFYLANGTDDDAALAGMEIGSVSSDANQIITLPAGTSAEMYTTLIVRCDKAKVVFGSAPLA